MAIIKELLSSTSVESFSYFYLILESSLYFFPHILSGSGCNSLCFLMKFAREIGARSAKINPVAHARHLAAELLASSRLRDTVSLLL